jgi:hypothetical protein
MINLLKNVSQGSSSIDFGKLGAEMPQPTGRAVVEAPTQSVSSTWTRMIWPRTARVAAPGVPDDLARDFNEAALVLADSPRASAAMSRRALQHMLREHYGIKKRDLEAEINELTPLVPSEIAYGLHALRQIGNFSAHPIKDQTTGEVIDVEPGEAEWMLHVLEMLFDHKFVAPQKAAEWKAQINEKLRAAGKPELE